MISKVEAKNNILKTLKWNGNHCRLGSVWKTLSRGEQNIVQTGMWQDFRKHKWKSRKKLLMSMTLKEVWGFCYSIYYLVNNWWTTFIHLSLSFTMFYHMIISQTMYSTISRKLCKWGSHNACFEVDILRSFSYEWKSGHHCRSQCQCSEA